MKRARVASRPGWEAKCDAVGFHYHSIGGTYWDEPGCYTFTADEIDVLEAAIETLHGMCPEACDWIVDRGRFAALALPDPFREFVAASWRPAHLRPCHALPRNHPDPRRQSRCRLESVGRAARFYRAACERGNPQRGSCRYGAVGRRRPGGAACGLLRRARD